jgi:hypothetical protein
VNPLKSLPSTQYPHIILSSSAITKQENMIVKKELIKVLGCLFFALVLFASCSESSDKQDPMEEEETPKGNLQLQITDAPVDDANVKAVFITAAAIELDGKIIDLDSPKTIEISALTKGQVETMFDKEIEAKNYSNLSLILAGEVNGQLSNYVVTKDDVKHNLLSSTNQIKISIPAQNIEVMERGNFSAVLDFDLRKTIVYDDGNDVDRYNFDANLDGSIRLVQGESFKIEGVVSDQLSIADDKVVVFVYQKGTFDADAETTGNIKFKNAVSSGSVDEDGKFSVHFLQKGNYDLVLANYQMEENGHLKLESILKTEVLAGINLGVITVDANVTTNLTVVSKVQI